VPHNNDQRAVFTVADQHIGERGVQGSFAKSTAGRHLDIPVTLAFVFERFTDRGRRALVLAQEESRILNHSVIGTEHLLLGLIGEQEGVAAKALESLGVSLPGARRQVEEIVELAAIAPEGSPPLTPRVKKVFELSFREALNFGHSHIGTEHLLLGLVGEGEGVGAQALRSMGVDLDRVRTQVLGLLPGYHDKESGARPPTSKSPVVPRCTGCHADVVEVARYRSIAIPSSAPNPFPMSVEVVYCNECGYVLSMFKAEPAK
jgi:hypothetical protein